jgi:type IV pilus assembly protein PilM
MIRIRTNSVGVDISTSSVKVGEIMKARKGLVLKNFAEEKIPVSALVAGVIRQPVLVEEALKTALASFKYKRREKRYAVCTIPDDKVYVQEGTFPKLPDMKLREAIQFKIQSFIPLPLTEVYWDYEIISENKDNTLSVAISAAAKETVDSYYDVLRKADLVPVAFESSSMSSLRLISQTDKQDMILVDIGKTQSTVSLAQNGVVTFNSTVHIGLNQIIKEYDEIFSIDDDKATQILHENGVDLSNADLKAKLIGILDPLKQEIARTSNYQQEKSVTTLYLFGEGSQIKGITEIITDNPAIKIQPLPQIITVPSSITYPTVIPLLGAAINHVQKYTKKIINFLPEKASHELFTNLIKEKVFFAMRIISINLVAYITVFIFLVFFLGIYQTYLDQKLTSVTANNNQAQYTQSQTTIENDNALLQKMSTASTYANDWIPYLEEVDALVPNNITLNSYSIGQASTSGWTVDIAGEATNRTALLAYLQNLEFNSSYLQNVTLPVSALQTDGTINFTINAMITKI